MKLNILLPLYVGKNPNLNRTYPHFNSAKTPWLGGGLRQPPHLGILAGNISIELPIYHTDALVAR